MTPEQVAAYTKAKKDAYWAAKGVKVPRPAVTTLRCGDCSRSAGTFEYVTTYHEVTRKATGRELRHRGCPGKPQQVPKTKPSAEKLLALEEPK